jgi:uncharacterized protein YigE (DUF2233 family)
MTDIIRKHPIAVDGKTIQRCSRVVNRRVVEIFYMDEAGRKFKNLHDLINNLPMGD